MKIEKINENQIRCTLTREDLESHQVNLKELAYGSEKAKKLFRDMMQQAQMQFGFEADNIPLMIEAIPVNLDSVILIITKVEDPEELDTRFSKFSPYKDNAQAEPLQLDGADNIIDIFQKICEAKMKGSPRKQSATKEDSEKPVSEAPTVNLIRLFSFSHLDDVIAAAHGLNGFFTGSNSLYKDSSDGRYQLVIHQSEYSPEEFNKICNILSEYGSNKAFSVSGEAHLKEHGELICLNALQQLTQI
ncbi:adaptor protein MecA [Blautia sp. MSJ-19]|uniref:adaptor protein MecA n=1 Tax=Blautia sp. MSJ-19 TaxID=2841517 RepID=UPI001C0F04CA|nr:adaptor protein MecA [Blautia sp. MSJ-19]MBU5479616.1 adaptor protein MecA [Blautia sp. MSJ-19]